MYTLLYQLIKVAHQLLIEFCIEDQLTFRCVITTSSYAWTVTGFLDGNAENGLISVGANEAVGVFLQLVVLIMRE